MDKYVAYYLTVEQEFAESVPTGYESNGQIHLVLVGKEQTYSYSLSFEQLANLLRGSEYTKTIANTIYPSIFPLTPLEK